MGVPFGGSDGTRRLGSDGARRRVSADATILVLSFLNLDRRETAAFLLSYTWTFLLTFNGLKEFD